MAKSTAQSRIFGKAKKAGARQWKQSRGKDAQVAGGSNLPGGIVGGVAVLVAKEWRETERDKTPFLLLQFAVADPEEHEGVKQSLTYFFADSKFRSIQDTTDRLSSDVQLMGGNVADVDLEGLDAELDELLAAETAIKFNTRAGKTDDGKAWFKFDIAGTADDYEGGGSEDEPEPDEDDSDDDYEDESDADEYEDDPDSEEYDEDESEEGESETDDEEYEDESEDDSEAEWSPERGEVYGFKPKGAKRSYECEVATVNNTKETVTLKRLSDGKRWSNVPWDKLEGGE